MTLKNTRFLLVGAMALAIVAPRATRVLAQGDQLPLNLAANMINMSNVAPGTATTVDIRITRWSTDAEREGLIRTFTEKGPAKLLDAVQDVKPPVGFIKLPNRLAYRPQVRAPDPARGRRLAPGDPHRSPDQLRGSTAAGADDGLSVHAG